MMPSTRSGCMARAGRLRLRLSAQPLRASDHKRKKAREIDRALTILEEAGRLTRASVSDNRGRCAETWRPYAAPQHEQNR